MNNRVPMAIGAICSLMMLFLLGPSAFLAPALGLTAILLTERTTLPAAATYLLTLVIGFGATLGLSEVICRIPGIRWLVLGIRKEKKA